MATNKIDFLVLRLKKADKLQLKLIAEKKDLTLSEYVRLKLLKDIPKEYGMLNK